MHALDYSKYMVLLQCTKPIVINSCLQPSGSDQLAFVPNPLLEEGQWEDAEMFNEFVSPLK